MNKCDTYFAETLRELLYKKNSTIGEDVRPKYADGTPSHTYFDTHKIFQYDISKGEFPISSLRPLAWKMAINEILAIYQGQSSLISNFEKYNCNWWSPWNVASEGEDPTIGNVYGETVKNHDLINKLLKGLKEQPYTRRHILNLWQENDFLKPHGLKPCAFLSMYSVRGEYLDASLIQRSSDFSTAANINQLQYVALQMMIAQVVGLKPGKFTHYIENIHMYDRHENACVEMIQRYNEYIQYDMGFEPKLILNTDNKDFYKFSINDFEVINYEPIKPQLKFELAI